MIFMIATQDKPPINRIHPYMKFKNKLYLAVMTSLASTPQVTAQAVDWTDFTSTSGNNVANGTILVNGTTSTNVTVTGCIAGTITNGTGTNFADASTFSPAIASGDVLRTDHIGSMGDFLITFSNPITNPIFHMADRHATFSATDTATSNLIEFDIVSGNLDYSYAGNKTSLKRNDWTFPMITASDSNNHGTTADGTFYMLGTFSQIKLNLSPEDFIYFQIGDDDYVPPVVPEPSTAILVSLSSLALARRKR